jgi:FkbM family methyltransferase
MNSWPAMGSTPTQSAPMHMGSMPLWIRAGRGLITRLPFGRYRLMNVLGRRAKAPFVAKLMLDRRAYRFQCNLQDGIAREVCFTGTYEPQETLILRQLIDPGQTFVDVGANWGYFTLLAAHCVGPTGRVISLEPDPRLFPQLQTNIKLNRLDNVTPLQIAAAACEGSMTMAGFDETGENFGVSRLVAATDPVEGRSFAVRTAPLDILLDECNATIVDMLKMDIEGAEALAVRGLEASIKKHRVRRLLIELHPQYLPRFGMNASELLQILLGYGYRCLRIAHDPRATRQAAYSRRARLTDFLMPVDSIGSLDSWPHLLVLAPGVDIPS